MEIFLEILLWVFGVLAVSVVAFLFIRVLFLVNYRGENQK